MAEARLHLRFAVELYKAQMDEGRLFVHEHPWGAKSWLEEEIMELIQKPEVILVKGDQCRFGLLSKEGEVVKKPTGFLTNSPQTAKELARECDGRHRHRQLAGGSRCQQAQVYPPELCKAICRGAARGLEFR